MNRTKTQIISDLEKLLRIIVDCVRDPKCSRLPTYVASLVLTNSNRRLEDIQSRRILGVSTSSLLVFENSLLERWQDSPETEVREFWRRCAEAGLPYVRKNLIDEILSRGSIRSRAEYEAAIDHLEGRTAREQSRLSKLIGVYESGRKKNRDSPRNKAAPVASRPRKRRTTKEK